MSMVRVGILGCASIAARYAIPALKSLPGVELKAVASRSVDKAREWGAKYSADAESYESLIARSDIDVVYSPLPVGLQEEWALRALESGKHVICEKSITYSYASAERMVEASKKAGVALYENFVPEFHPQHQAVLELVAQGAIGTPRVWIGFDGYPFRSHSDIRYQLGLKGGSLNYAGCYTVFMSRKMYGNEPIAVTCRLDRDSNGVDIRGSAFLEFSEGIAHMSFGLDLVYQNTYSIWGSAGLIRVPRAFAIPPDFAPTFDLVTNDGTKEEKRTFDISPCNQFEKSFEFFFRTIQNDGTTAFSDLRLRILNQAKALEAMRISAAGAGRVKLDTV